eukprot:TRINITY_DN3649_c0_g1_i7.p1 TRINITY_DN3649_c0_g1~~TRINITY_DN3649_c0_g1_i7.p1  ORF type:complete len:553 (+),score=94.89 TRINITY_DN3649_c0_g1_i7:79-1659(+)
MSSIDKVLEVVLQKVKSGDKHRLKDAEDQTKAWEEENLAGYAYSLAVYMATTTKAAEDRILCGVLLRGIWWAKDPAENALKQQKWIKRVPEEAKVQIKDLLLKLLQDPIPQVGNQAAQIIARIALIELPLGGWKNLIPLLLDQMTREGVPSVLKRSTLDTIGYICEEIPPEVLTSAADQILTAIIHGMRPQESDEQVKLCACKALFLALAFCQKNFENRTECAIIMESVLNAMIVSNDDIRVSAYAILTEIATLHYSVLPPFMQQIFKLTMTAITETDEEDITKSAIEFWCTIADEELNLLEEIEYTKEKGGQVPHCENFIKGALPFLVPLLNKCLVLQKKDSDPDEWTIPMAAGVCLSLVAQTVKDEVVQYVLPFVEANITSQDWKCREAAVLAFGSILEGPVNVIQKLISQAIGVLLTHLKDPITAVKDTTAWTLGSILKLHPRAVVSAAEGILKGLCESLGDPKPRVASHACFAIHNLAASYEGDPANPLQRHFVEVSLRHSLEIFGNQPTGCNFNLFQTEHV